LKYEDKIQRNLADEFGDVYAWSPWFQFREIGSENPRWCQPDGLLFQPLHGLITIVEIKYQHTSAAWWQMKMLYHPVVARLFPANLWRFNFCEVVRWHDPVVKFPEPYRMVPSLAILRPGEVGVHILNP
jgi:hypothetical protein